MLWLHSDWKLIFALQVMSLIELTSTPLLITGSSTCGVAHTPSNLLIIIFGVGKC